MAIGITNAGGGARPKGFLLVNFPSGATITVTNTSAPMPITATQNLYYVKFTSGQTSQTCVITITNGTETVAKTVSVDLGKQVVVTIDFNLYVFYDGTPAGSGVFTLLGGGSARSGADYYGSTTNGSQSIFTTNAIDVTIYSTLHIKIKFHSSTYGSGECNICAGLNSTQIQGIPWRTHFDSGIELSESVGAGDATIDTSYDISNLTGNWYYGITGWLGTNSYYDIYRIWLEY